MTWPQVALAGLNVFQVVALAAIGAWLKRSQAQVRTLNGQVAQLTEKLDEATAKL